MRTLVLLLVLTACKGSSITPSLPPDSTDPTVETDVDGDGYTADVDCDDTDAAVHPDATEVCNSIDDDCDGQVDNDPIDGVTYYTDQDHDGFGSEGGSLSCQPPPDSAELSGDCDDTNDAVNPEASERCNNIDDDCDGRVDIDAIDPTTFYMDADEDGFGDVEITVCFRPPGVADVGHDCNDNDSTVHPNAEELCNHTDDDCDGDVDEHATDPTTFYTDADEDGFGDEEVVACFQPIGAVTVAGDCDDTNDAVHPDAVEVCNGEDDDCDGTTDLNAADVTTWYADEDQDTFGGAAISACVQPADTVDLPGDCDDTDENVHPNADEICNTIDDNCDGITDEDALDRTNYYGDADGDGYGTGPATLACDQPAGTSLRSTDCDDQNGAVNPGADELCNTVDDNCDGITDEDAIDRPTWYVDQDQDGYGDGAGPSTTTCDGPVGSVDNGDDCDDSMDAISPDADEIACNSEDEDCDGVSFRGDVIVPDQFGTMAAAIDAAVSGDTICVEGGDYGELVSVAGKDLTIRGNGQTRFHTGNGARVYVAGSGVQRLENVILDGGGTVPLVQVSGNTHLTMTNVKARNVGCTTSCGGSIAFLYGNSTLIVEGMEMEATTLDFPIGVSMNGLFYGVNQATLEVRHSSFNNSTYNMDWSQSQYFIGNASFRFDVLLDHVDFLNNTIRGNTVVRLVNSPGPVRMDHVRFINNDLSANTVGLVRVQTTSELKHVTFSNNLLAGGQVAGIEVAGPTVIENAVFAQNQYSNNWAGMVHVERTGDLQMTNVDIVDNTASSGSVTQASALQVDNHGIAWVSNTNFVGGAAPSIRDDGSLVITFSNLFDNPSPIVDGAGDPLTWSGLTVDPLYATRSLGDFRLGRRSIGIRSLALAKAPAVGRPSNAPAWTFDRRPVGCPPKNVLLSWCRSARTGSKPAGGIRSQALPTDQGRLSARIGPSRLLTGVS